ncbi:MAG: transposase [Candidatus Contendobacter sp.]|nr:transposase [Candidatus Contendobacter sp.]
MARFIVELVETLDTRAIEGTYRGGGSAPYLPKMMLALLFYGYAKGIFSSRALEQATYERIPVLYITGGTHPDHDTINTFRQRFLPEFEALFVQVLTIAHELGVLKLGEVSLDGTKIEANASKHQAMSWGYAERLEQQLKAEVQLLLERAAAISGPGAVELDWPAELKRREDRLQKIAEVKAEIERRAQERYRQEQAEYEAKQAERAAQEQARGRKLGGKKPQEPVPGPRPNDQVNFTDGDSRIMPMPGGGFEQAYNAQATVTMGSRLIVGVQVTQNPNDKQEIEPALAEWAKLPETLGAVEQMAADSGYFSQHNVDIVVNAGIEPLIAVGRQRHHAALEERLAPVPDAPPNPDALGAMKHRLKTPEGKAVYARRKTTVEPVFGIIKAVMGFRRFMLRGLAAVKGEWRLACLAYNLKRLCVLHQGVIAS